MSPAEAFSHSLLIASDYRVPDPSRVWPLLQRRKAGLADIGAHHVGVYLSTTDPGRVLVTIGVHNREPIVDLLRSRIFFDWFDAVGVHDIPAVFAGEKAAKFDVTATAAAPDIVLAAIAAVDDVPALVAAVRRDLAGFRAAGVRNMWIFQAFDDEHEVLVLHELADEASARAWIEDPAPAAVWMHRAGRGAYPPLFVGKFAHMMRIEA
ncbi:fatty-acid--CoA ligase [Mycobacterium sp. pUA109]|uniref:fatty-acid--CoA ligase n=1 Tax=Mycobacterium sp. pUA109 TaxID=3238982 RepID=UPI00351B8513